MLYQLQKLYTVERHETATAYSKVKERVHGLFPSTALTFTWRDNVKRYVNRKLLHLSRDIMNAINVIK